MTGSLYEQIEKLKKTLDDLERHTDGFLHAQKRRVTHLVYEQERLAEQKEYADGEKIEAVRQRNQEMNRADQIQMELEVTKRERDIALRNQGLSSTQKQALARLELESYKIAESLERLNGLSEDIEKLLA